MLEGLIRNTRIYTVFYNNVHYMSIRPHSTSLRICVLNTEIGSCAEHSIDLWVCAGWVGCATPGGWVGGWGGEGGVATVQQGGQLRCPITDQCSTYMRSKVML